MKDQAGGVDDRPRMKNKAYLAELRRVMGETWLAEAPTQDIRIAA